MNIAKPNGKRGGKHKAIRIAIEVVIGAAAGLVTMRFLTGAFRDGMATGNFAVLAVGVLLLFAGVVAILVSLSRRMTGIRMGDELGEDPLDDDEMAAFRKMVIPSSLVLGLIGVIFILLAFTSSLMPLPTLGAIFASIAIVAVGSIYAHRQQDEMYRQASREASFITLNIGFIGLIVWIALAEYGLVAAVDPMLLLAMLMLVLLGATYWAAGKRSMIN